MLLFGHIGFTLASFMVVNRVMPAECLVSRRESVKQPENQPGHLILSGCSFKFWNLIKAANRFDLRFIIIGSLLPDIIDKPIGHYFFYNVFGTGILYCHTLSFVLFLSLLGTIIYKLYKNNSIFLLAFGSLIHLILDFIFLQPRIFFWPLFGLTLPRDQSLPLVSWLLDLINQLLTTPWMAIPELIGAAITIWFSWLLWRQKAFRSFILSGRI
jgi:inner membrane protein